MEPLVLQGRLANTSMTVPRVLSGLQATRSLSLGQPIGRRSSLQQTLELRSTYRSTQALPVGRGTPYRSTQAEATSTSRESSWSSGSQRVGAQTRTASVPSAAQQAERVQQLNALLEEVARMAVRTGPRGAVRFLQGAEAVVTVGGEWLLDQIRTLQQMPGGARTSPESLASLVTPPGPAQLRRLFERLGATYIKLGQFIASTPTFFPREYVEEFQKCLDQTPAVPFSEIRAIIREELGRPIEDVFEFIDEKPLASASVAQVHAARLRGTSSDVVIKVLKPGAGDILTVDLDFLYISARALEFLNPELARTSLVGIVSDIRASMLEEVDLRKEATNMEAFRRYLDAMGLAGEATAPYVYRHASARRMLTMERLYGVPLTDLDAIRTVSRNPEATLISALNVWFGSLVGCESFHADVHAGNLLVLRDGRVGFIDFGIVGRISPATWTAVQTFLLSVGIRDYEAMASALAIMGATDDEVDVRAFAADLAKIFSAVENLDSDIMITATQGGVLGDSARVSASLAVDEQQINSLLLDVISASEKYGLRFPREFGLLLKQLLYFDRYTRLLAPELNVLSDDRILIGGGL